MHHISYFLKNVHPLPTKPIMVLLFTTFNPVILLHCHIFIFWLKSIMHLRCILSSIFLNVLMRQSLQDSWWLSHHDQNISVISFKNRQSGTHLNWMKCLPGLGLMTFKLRLWLRPFAIHELSMYATLQSLAWLFLTAKHENYWIVGNKNHKYFIKTNVVYSSDVTTNTIFLCP